MLTVWFLGDLFNLVAVLILDALMTQVVAGVYYMCIDSVLIFQFFYYGDPQQQQQKQSDQQQQKSLNEQKKKTRAIPKQIWLLLIIVCAILMWYHFGFKFMMSSSTSSDNKYTSQQEKSHDDSSEFEWPIQSNLKLFGYVVGSLSNAFYVLSRIPQIMANSKNQSTEGQSPILFLSFFMGNVTYFFSLLSYSTDSRYIMLQLPWIIGSGLFMMDLTLFYQVSSYSAQNKKHNFKTVVYV
jgi:uncharacterized protein with PQ loop repeat